MSLTNKATITNIYQRVVNNRKRINKYVNYYEGKHDKTFNHNDILKLKKFGDWLSKISINISRIVADSYLYRLKIEKVSADSDILNTYLQELYLNLYLEDTFNEVFLETLITGYCAALVVKDEDNQVKINVQNSRNTLVVYDKNRQPEIVATVSEQEDENIIEPSLEYGKLVPDKQSTELTIYSKDTVYRYNVASRGASFNLIEKFDTPNNELPFVIFKIGTINKLHGLSVLDNTITLQDILNRTWSAIMVGEEEAIRKQRLISGLQVLKDKATNKDINPFDTSDEFLFTNQQDIELHDLKPSIQIDQLLDVRDKIIAELTTITSIPQSYLGLKSAVSGNMSGDALRQLEQRFTSNIKNMQLKLTKPIKDLFYKILKDTPYALDNISIAWSNPAPEGYVEFLDNSLKKLKLGWSNDEIMREYGFTDKKIEQIESDKQKQKQIERQNNNDDIFRY